MYTESNLRRTANGASARSPYTRTLLALCISAAIAPAVWAQTPPPAEQQAPAATSEEADATELDTIVVTGIRASLKTAQDIKRDADTHVDAIAASDINALPDVSVLEALQRVPGISIERFAAKDDPDHFSTEGSGITLRGLPNTRSEFNGRDTFSANSGRGLSFQDVSPELLGSVEVFKNQSADMVEGGISGTVNLNTRKPFDSGDDILTFSAQANYGDLEGTATPSLSGLYSKRFETAGGNKLGFLVSLAKSTQDFRSDGAQFGPHTAPEDANGNRTGPYTPINAGIRTTSTERDREGASLAFQFANSDNSFKALGEYIRSDSRTNWLEYAFFSDDGSGSPGPDSVYAGDVFQSGTLTNIGSAFGPQTRRQDGNTLVEDFSAKFEFAPTDRLRLSTDLQYVKSNTDVVDLSVFGGMANPVNAQVALNGDTPIINFLPGTASTQTPSQFFSDPRNYFWRAAMDHIEESEGDQKAARVDLEFDLDAGFARSIEAGVRWSERDQTTRWSNYNWGNLSESWRGGRALFDGTPSGPGYTNNQQSPFSFGDFHGGNVGGLPGGVGLFANAALVSDYNTFRANFNNVPGSNRTALEDRDDAIGFYIPSEINSTLEENSAAYVRLNFEFDGERRLAGNIGLRYVKQDTTVKGGITYPSNDQLSGIDPRFPAPAAVVAYATGTGITGNEGSSFDTILPSLNISYELTPDMILRFGASKALAFPDLGNLRYNYSQRVVTRQIPDPANPGAQINVYDRIFQSSGNPFLKPMEANNFDLSLEYYFGDSDYVSAAFFYKDIKDFFANTSEVVQFTNNGVTVDVEVDQPRNIDTATLSGFELGYQQFFTNLPGIWSGLGMQFNYTYLKPSDVPQQNLRAVQSGTQTDADRASIPFDGLPLQSLSENQFNLVGIFDNDKVEARLAYNWRDDYLLTIREVNIGLPVFADAFGQLDGSFFYKLNDEWQLGIQASNLLQDEIVTRNLLTSDGPLVFRSSFVYDRRYSLVIRGNF